MKKIMLPGLLVVFAIASLKGAPIDTIAVKSPDSYIQCKWFLQHDTIYYTITCNQAVVIERSPMIMLIDNKPVTGKIATGALVRYTIDEKYPWRGAHATAANNCNGLKIPLRHQKTTDTLEVRVFNNGVAFRMIVPGAATAQRVPDEATLFNIPAGSTIWYHDLEMHYEGVHVKKNIGDVHAAEWAAPPVTYKLPNGYYASITEANLVNYPGMALQANGANGLQVRLPNHQRASYPYRLRYSPDDTLRLQQPAAIGGTIITPWRVLIIGSDLNALVNSDIVHDLCPPPDRQLFPEGIHTAWLRPGRAVWKYLDGGGEGTPDVLRKFTDEAAGLGFEHNILEGYWARWGDDTLKQFIDYSAQKKVGIWLWKHSKSLRNANERQAFFKHCRDLGVTGLKIDFFDHEAKEVIDLYSAILREAAENHLMLDFHGANKPTGLARTWPNLLTSEAVKGMEASKLADRATHETTLPFTRCLAGPAEYTVLSFGDRRKNTTWAHQVASAAILNASLLTYAAQPANILSSPAASLIKNIPAVWDETIVLPASEIGELAAYARRTGNSWFIAIMNGNAPKKISIPLKFLSGENYAGTEVKDDGSNAASLIVNHKNYSATDTIDLDLAPGGGYIAEFVK